METKRCGRCRQVKTLDAFPLGAGTHGRFGYCRDCKNAYWREHHPAPTFSYEHLTDAERGYIAGIIDGEGSISLNFMATYAVVLRVSNTCLALIEWLHEKIGGAYGPVERRPDPRHKPIWRWSLGTQQGAALLQTIRPHLVVKRTRADLVAEFVTLRRRYREERRAAVGRAKDRPPRGEPRFEALRARMLALNRRGLP